MKAEHATNKAVRAGRATQIAAMVLTGTVACIWVYFGRLYLSHDPAEWRIANQQLGYPLYIIPLIGVTHILGGVGLLIPNMPRLTQWIYAGLVINLLLAFYSQLNGGGRTCRHSSPRHQSSQVLSSRLPVTNVGSMNTLMIWRQLRSRRGTLTS
jgi:uncharacterized membrane protein